MLTPHPVQKSTREETFHVLCTDFNLDKKAEDLIISSGIMNLEEFRFYFVKEEEVATFLAKITDYDAPDRRLMETRLRRAWHAVRQHGILREADRSRSDAADLDDLLDESSLKDVKNEFWKRYKLRFPTEVTPADALISRCYREISRRMLMVFNVWSAGSHAPSDFEPEKAQSRRRTFRLRT